MSVSTRNRSPYFASPYSDSSACRYSFSAAITFPTNARTSSGGMDLRVRPPSVQLDSSMGYSLSFSFTCLPSTHAGWGLLSPDRVINSLRLIAHRRFRRRSFNCNRRLLHGKRSLSTSGTRHAPRPSVRLLSSAVRSRLYLTLQSPVWSIWGLRVPGVRGGRASTSPDTSIIMSSVVYRIAARPVITQLSHCSVGPQRLHRSGWHACLPEDCGEGDKACPPLAKPLAIPFPAT